MIITSLIAKIILGGYWLMLAPVLFLPLGTLLLSSQAPHGLFGHAVTLISVLFAAARVILLFTLPFADAVTAFVGVLALWCLAAAITHLARKREQRGRKPQELRTAKASITR